MSGELARPENMSLAALQEKAAAQPGFTDESVVPSFIIVGLPDGSLLASSTLTQAEMRRTVEGVSRVPVGRGIARVPRFRNRLLVQFEDFILIRGHSFADSLRSLAEQWKP